jgi:Cu2+-exporting ATPase
VAGAAARPHQHGTLISIGVLLAYGMSLYETIDHGPHAYFDAATLAAVLPADRPHADHLMREGRALPSGSWPDSRRAAFGAVQPDGSPTCRVRDFRALTVLLAAAIACRSTAWYRRGRSEIDSALVSGEPAACRAAGDRQAGTLQPTPRPLVLEAMAAAALQVVPGRDDALMEAAEAGARPIAASPIAPRGSLRAGDPHHCARPSPAGWRRRATSIAA